MSYSVCTSEVGFVLLFQLNCCFNDFGPAFCDLYFVI